jgi:hypothetical protein
MKLNETLKQLSQVDINENSVNKIENAYKVKLSEELKKIVSLHGETIFYDDFSLLRGLSVKEILDASNDMSVDFIGKNLLPLFDVGDNDYFVFDFAEKCWYKFNIVDEVKFSKAETIDKYLRTK